MYDTPIIRLSLEQMRYEIVHAFSKYNDELEVKVDKAVQEAIKNFDFDREVSRISMSLMNDMINQSLKRAFERLKWDEAMTKALTEILLKELRRDLPNS